MTVTDAAVDPSPEPLPAARPEPVALPDLQLEPPPVKAQRLTSLDVFRGITIWSTTWTTRSTRRSSTRSGTGGP